MVEKYLTSNDYAEGTAAKHFFFSSIVMLNIGVFLALGTSMRLAWPDIFPNDIPWLHFGRIRPVHVHFVIFGWISMAFAGAMCYMTPALCKNPALEREARGVELLGVERRDGLRVLHPHQRHDHGPRVPGPDLAARRLHPAVSCSLPLAINIWMTMFRRKAQGPCT